MYALNSQSVVSGQSPSDYYSGIVFDIGNDASNASAEQSASSLVLQQLNDQRASISGVSLDEEASNLTQYQRSYQAASQVFNIVDTLMASAINLGVETAVS